MQKWRSLWEVHRGSLVKNLSACNAGSILDGGRSPGGRNGNSLQYSYQGKSYGQRSLMGWLLKGTWRKCFFLLMNVFPFFLFIVLRWLLCHFSLPKSSPIAFVICSGFFSYVKFLMYPGRCRILKGTIAFPKQQKISVLEDQCRYTTKDRGQEPPSVEVFALYSTTQAWKKLEKKVQLNFSNLMGLL